MIQISRFIVNRFGRLAVCALIVLGQLVGAFGWAASTPIMVRGKGPCGTRACGCRVVNEADSCCCEIPKPEPPPCCQPAKSCCAPAEPRSCCGKTNESRQSNLKTPKGTNWLANLMAQRCHAKAPPGAVAADPEVPPDMHVDRPLPASPSQRLIPFSEITFAPPADPPTPPPRLV